MKDQRATRFIFINASQDSPDVDDKSRSLIRRHAKRSGLMRGNSSVSLPTKSPQVVIGVEEATIGPLQALVDIRQIEGVDPFGTSPIKLQPYMLDLLSYCMYCVNPLITLDKTPQFAYTGSSSFYNHL